VEEIQSQLLCHQAVWWKDTITLGGYCRKGNVINGVDHHGNTPLALAHQLGHFDIFNFLLSRGADPRIPTSKGWTILEDACTLRQEQVVMDILLHTVLLKQKEWEENLPRLSKALHDMPNFYMEIDWKIESWVPLVSRLAPSDTFKIWKQGGNLRFDSTVQGMNGFNVEKGLSSFLFNSESIYLVNHQQETFSDALSEFRRPSYERIKFEASSMMAGKLPYQGISANDIKFVTKKSLLGYDRVDKVGPYNCRMVDMSGLEFSMINLKAKEKRDTSSNFPFTFDQYFIVPEETKHKDSTPQKKEKREKR